MRPPRGLLLVPLLLQACVRVLPPEERLERETVTTPPAAAGLATLSCAGTGEELAKARDVSRDESARVRAYLELYDALRKKRDTFHQAMAREPDLAYGEGSGPYVAARDVCVQQAADVRVEFEQYVRELIEVPTVQDLRGGHPVTVARLDFETLRRAIASLDPEDKETLVSRVNSAEQRLSEGETAPVRRRK